MTSAHDNGADVTIAYDGRNRPVKRVISPGLLPTSAVSRKIHGPAGAFDIALPVTGAAGVESRSGSVLGAHQLVVTFPRAITFANANVTSGTGSVAATTSSPDGLQVTIDLVGVTNAQTIVVTLTGATDGTLTNDILIGMGVLLGDATGDGSVNSADRGLVSSLMARP